MNDRLVITPLADTEADELAAIARTRELADLAEWDARMAASEAKIDDFAKLHQLPAGKKEELQNQVQGGRNVIGRQPSYYFKCSFRVA